MRKVIIGATAFLALALPRAPLPSVAAQEPTAAAKTETPVKSLAAADIARIWPASLGKIAGRYVFVPVASPGGLWERFTPATGGPAVYRQVSINEVPAALRDRLTRAEIVISGIETPTVIEANERESPSKRGMLRFYTETAPGRLVVRGLPGIGGGGKADGDYSGPVVFQLNHQSHSNPSVFGILSLRQQQEMMWGAATIDYADLTASTAPSADKPEDEGEPVLGNARLLRSGTEIFSYVDWEQRDKKGTRVYTGSVRLVREAPPAAEEQF